MNDVDFSGTNGNGWIVGAAGSISRSTDGGATWGAQSSPTSKDLYSVHSLNTSDAWAAGSDGVIVYTTDGGANWKKADTTALDGVALVEIRVVEADVDGTDRQVGFALGSNGRLFRSEDGGLTWAEGTDAGSGTFSAMDAVAQ